MTPVPNIGAITSLFTRYGFRPGYSSDPSSHVVFTIRSGYFHQAEILVLDNAQESAVAHTRRELEETGFACSTRTFVRIKDLEDRLFQGFFGVADSRDRHEQHYRSFVQRIERSTGGTYNYVAAPYYRDDTPVRDHSVVEDVVAELAAPQATLVLIEAAAGFGKTCTAYEVLRALLERQPDHPPLFVELARNRQAPLFRYVLLDEIDRNYPSLRSELVTSEISSGKVPLIVDGFDELLRRSVDGAQGPLDVGLGLDRRQAAQAVRSYDFCPSGDDREQARQIFPQCGRPGSTYGDAWVVAHYRDGRTVRLQRFERWADADRATARWSRPKSSAPVR